MTVLAFGVYVSIVQTHNLFYIGKPETETFYVVAVAGMHSVETVEYLVKVFALYAYSVVLYAYHHVASVVARGYTQFQRFLFAAIFEGVVQKIEYHVGQMNFVAVNNGMLCAEVGSESSVHILHFYEIGMGNVFYHLVHVEFAFVVACLVVLVE